MTFTAPSHLMGMRLPDHETMGRAMLYHLKRGIAVHSVRVWLTHQNIHTLWSGPSKTSERIRKQYPLSIAMPRLGEKPEIIDCRKFTAPWDVALPAPKPQVFVDEIAKYQRQYGDRPHLTEKTPASGEDFLPTPDALADFHPPAVPPLTILDDVGHYDVSALESLPSPADRH